MSLIRTLDNLVGGAVYGSNAPRLNIGSFTSEINKHGIIRTNHFMVRFSTPKTFTQNSSIATSQGDPNAPPDENDRLTTVKVSPSKQEKYFTSDDIKKLTLRCESATLPDINLTTVEGHRYGYGSIDMVPYAAQFSDLNLEFLLDGKGKVYQLLYEWMARCVGFNYDTTNGVNNQRLENGVPTETYEVGYKDDLVSTVQLFVFDSNKRPMFVVNAYNAYPRLIFGSQLNWQDRDNMIRLTVPFLFKDFTIDFVADRGIFGLYDRLRDFSLEDLAEEKAKDILKGIFFQ